MKYGGRAAWAAVTLAAAILALAGCTRPVGDFGRAAPSVLHDAIMPAAGAARAGAAGEPVSGFNLTDQESEMHNRVWRFLIAPHAHDWFYDTAVELQRTRLSGATDTSFSPDRYYNHLRSTRYASSRVRYQTVANDIWIDISTAPATFAAICAVIEVDRQRAIAVANVASAGTGAEAQVAARRAENEAHIAWFTRALRYRYQSYSMALDRLLVETPHEEARLVAERLSELEIYVRRAEAGDFCGAAAPQGSGTVPSRFEIEPVYTK